MLLASFLETPRASVTRLVLLDPCNLLLDFLIFRVVNMFKFPPGQAFTNDFSIFPTLSPPPETTTRHESAFRPTAGGDGDL
jgi:hypothetical protein